MLFKICIQILISAALNVALEHETKVTAGFKPVLASLVSVSVYMCASHQSIKLYLYSTFHTSWCNTKCFTQSEQTNRQIKSLKTVTQETIS